MNAGLIVATNNATPLAIPGLDLSQAPLIGAALFAALIIISYVWVSRQAKE
jgi:hypothetical protein